MRHYSRSEYGSSTLGPTVACCRYTTPEQLPVEKEEVWESEFWEKTGEKVWEMENRIV